MATQTLTLDALRMLGRTGDPARFIWLSSAALAQGIQDDELRLLLMQRLAERGLLRRARALAHGLSPAARAQPEFDAMVRLLAPGGGDGCVPWHRFNAQFETNLDAARQRYPWTDQLLANWNAERRYLELHVPRTGSPQVFDRRGGDAGGWRPAFADHRPQPPVDSLRAQFRNQVLPPLVIEGVGLGYHLPWLYAATADTFLGASAVIYQIETCWAALAVALHLNDWSAVITDPRVRLCCGPGAYAEFRSCVAADAWNVAPVHVVTALPWEPAATGGAQHCIEELASRVEANASALRTAVAAAYRGRDRAWWQRRFAAALSGEGAPLRVLGITSRFTTVLQYSMRDALAAMEANGCQTRLLIEPTDFARVPPARRLETLREFEPDLVFLIDHTRAGQRAGLVENVPVVTWIQDRLPWLFDRATGAALGDLDFCMGFAKRELVEQCGYPAGRFLPCEMATNPAALVSRGDDAGCGAAGDDLCERFRCDLAYATNFNGTPDAFFQDYLSRAAPNVRPVVQAIRDELVSMAGRNALNGGLRWDYLLAHVERMTGIALEPVQRNELAGGFARALADRLLRHQTIAWAGAWAEATGRRFHLYGRGWDEYPPFARFARGFVPHGPELGAVFRAAQVHLHAGCNTALHQRVLDGLAAGGRFLVRHHALDFGNRSLRSLDRLVQARNLGPGATVRPGDLPAREADAWIEYRRLTGDPDPIAPLPITPALLAHLARLRAATPLTADSFQPELHVASDLWPELDRVTFASAEELAARLDWHLVHEDQSRQLSATMRARVLEILSYEALMKRLLRWLAATLNPVGS